MPPYETATIAEMDLEEAWWTRRQRRKNVNCRNGDGFTVDKLAKEISTLMKNFVEFNQNRKTSKSQWPMAGPLGL